jgi:predicted TIM-barrel fold metal-dependent hydrolase
MIVDALVVAGENRFRAGGLTLAELAAAAIAAGIDALVAAPGRPFDYHLGPANDALVEAASSVDMPVARLGRVDPLDGERAAAEAERCLDELGCVGLFLHPGEEVFPVRLASPIVSIAAARDVPVVVAAGAYSLSEPLQLFDFARAHPDVNIVMTSGGQLNISGLGMIDAWLAMQRAPNLHVMTDGVYRQDFIERLARDLDPHRLIAGSFAPYFELGYERRRVVNASLAPAARALVEGGNAQRLFALPD